MRMKNSFRNSLLLAPTLVISMSAFAVDCKVSKDELSKASKNMPDSDRLLGVESLHNDILELVSISDRHEGKPKSYWQTCLNYKVKSLNKHITHSSDKLRDNADFHVLLSSNFEMRGEYGRAYYHGMQAIKKLPKDYNLRLRVFNLWLNTQKVLLDIENARTQVGRRQNMVALGDQNEFDKKVTFFLGTIINDNKADRFDRISAYRVRASYFEALGRIVDAAEDWEKIASQDPKEVKSLKKLAAFELSRQRKTVAKKYLLRVLKVLPSDLGAHKKLIEIYLDRREVQRAKQQLSLALRYYPDDNDLLELKKTM